MLFFSELALIQLGDRADVVGTRLSAFGMTRRRGVTCADDEGLQALLRCDAPVACLVAKAWDEQCTRVLGKAVQVEHIRLTLG